MLASPCTISLKPSGGEQNKCPRQPKLQYGATDDVGGNNPEPHTCLPFHVACPPYRRDNTDHPNTPK